MPNGKHHPPGSGAVRRKAERNPPPVWPPAAMSARLSAQRALDALPRRAWGVSAEARSELALIVEQVDEHLLAPELAAEQLRYLTARLLLHRQAQDAIRDRPRWSPVRQRLGPPHRA